MNRLDREVFARGIASSRERASVLIKGGNISIKLSNSINKIK